MTETQRMMAALEAPEGEDPLYWAAMRTSAAKVCAEHLEQCRKIMGGKVASVPDTVQALVDALIRECRCKACRGRGCINCHSSGCAWDVDIETRKLLDEIGIDFRKLARK